MTSRTQQEIEREQYLLDLLTALQEQAYVSTSTPVTVTLLADDGRPVL